MAATRNYGIRGPHRIDTAPAPNSVTSSNEASCAARSARRATGSTRSWSGLAIGSANREARCSLRTPPTRRFSTGLNGGASFPTTSFAASLEALGRAREAVAWGESTVPSAVAAMLAES